MPMTGDGFKEPDNNDRADFANDAVAAYVQRTRPNDEYPEEIGTGDPDIQEMLAEALRDLLCDLRHWADVVGLDFTDQNEMGMVHYDEEVHGEELRSGRAILNAEVTE